MCEIIIGGIIEGVFTLLGTLLGFLLGKINVGKLYFDFTLKEKIEDSFFCSATNSDGSSCMLGTLNLKEIKKGNLKLKRLSNFKLLMDIKIYNSSEKDNVMSDLEISLVNNRNPLLNQGIIDPATKKHSHAMSTAEECKVLIIPSKQAVYIPVDVSFPVNDEMRKSTNISLMYKNKKFKQKRKVIIKLKFSELVKELEDSYND